MSGLNITELERVLQLSQHRELLECDLIGADNSHVTTTSMPSLYSVAVTLPHIILPIQPAALPRFGSEWVTQHDRSSLR